MIRSSTGRALIVKATPQSVMPRDDRLDRVAHGGRAAEGVAHVPGRRPTEALHEIRRRPGEGDAQSKPKRRSSHAYLFVPSGEVRSDPRSHTPAPGMPPTPVSGTTGYTRAGRRRAAAPAGLAWSDQHMQSWRPAGPRSSAGEEPRRRAAESEHRVDVLIIGGSGLISTAITRQLLDRGDRVTHFNRGTTEQRFSGTVRRIVGDRKDTAGFEAQVSAAGPFDCVVDMICYTPADAHSLLRAVQGQTKHLIVCSTVDVYAKPYRTIPSRESHPLQGVSAYGQDKARCEASCSTPTGRAHPGDHLAPGADLRRGARHHPRLRPGHRRLQAPPRRSAGDRPRRRQQPVGGLLRRRRRPRLRRARRTSAPSGEPTTSPARSGRPGTATPPASPRASAPPRRPSCTSPPTCWRPSCRSERRSSWRTSASTISSTTRPPTPTSASGAPCRSSRAYGAPPPGSTRGAGSRPATAIPGRTG